MRTVYVTAAVAVVALMAGLGLGLGIAAPGAGSTVTTTVQQSSILVSDPSPYFPSHLSKTVDMSGVSDGDVIGVGLAGFSLSIPSNIETWTTQHGGTSTVVTATVDYQCGVSLGQRVFFDAKLPNAMVVRLDYCLVLNNAVETAQRSGNVSMNWSLWQVTLGTYPVVALHLSGTGGHVDQVELWSSA